MDLRARAELARGVPGIPAQRLARHGGADRLRGGPAAPAAVARSPQPASPDDLRSRLGRRGRSPENQPARSTILLDMSVRWGNRAQGLAGVAAALTLLLALALPASARAADQASVQQRLVNEYSPILEIRKQTDPPCQTSAEQYQPTSVDTMLGNPNVTLERSVPGRRRLQAIRKGPTAQQVAGLGPELLPEPARQPARRHLRVRARLRQARGAGQGAGDHLRPHRPRDRTLRLRPAVLVLLVLQPVQRSPRGRLGGHAARVGVGHARAGADAAARRADPVPARRRRARQLGRHEGPQGGQPPDRVSGRRLARDVLRLGRVRAERRTRLRARLRQHERAAARAAPAAGPAPGVRDRDRASSRG